MVVLSRELWNGGNLADELCVRTPFGDKVCLRSTGKGGAEGVLYDVIGNKNLVAKLFNSPHRAGRKREKVKAQIEFFKEMRRIRRYIYDYLSESIMLPRSRLYTADGKFCGFLMNRVPMENCISLGSFMKEKYRDYKKPEDYPIKLLTILRLTEIVERLNREKIVAGDLNCNNVFVCRCSKKKIRVVLIDVDSFQFSWKGELYLLDGIHPELVPPEVLRGERITTRADSFVLAILYFRILMGGFSPFQFVSNEEETLEEKKEKGKNVFNTGEKPPGLPPLELLGDLKSFIVASLSPEPKKRYSTTHALAIIKGMVGSLQMCRRGHYYCGTECPFCRFKVF